MTSKNEPTQRHVKDEGASPKMAKRLDDVLRSDECRQTRLDGAGPPGNTLSSIGDHELIGVPGGWRLYRVTS